ncbi:type I polyketide synthase [Candidatus Chloroploca sp. Khr17]|uniref:type I polyketide synthase n=1 Tax=Candidatus Chloroploca sp. Khr17 TaxID=2496869 RepID=UPI00101CCF5D|nr:type I polyketide synthase [Candidatus Chloroploca sp. Khr17]
MDEELRNLLLNQGWAYQEGRHLFPTKQGIWLEQPEQLLVTLASWGYFPSPEGLLQLLDRPSDTALALDRFTPYPYHVRRPTIGDLDTLVALEAATWPMALCAPRAEIQQRVEQYPEGHLVAVLEQRVVGVIYSQRITATEALLHSNFREVASLHAPNGPITQLLAVNVLPEAQDYALGDHLLEFMLQLCTLNGSIERVVGVTRCKSYQQHADLAMEDYIQLRTGRGQHVDPVLNFHASHGAEISRVIAGYRPPDDDNRGTGVLVEYNDLRTRLARRQEARRLDPVAPPAAAIPALVDQAVREVLGSARSGAYVRRRPLRELGLDSVELLELRLILHQLLGCEIAPTVFFRYPTPEALIGYLQRTPASTPSVTPRPVDAPAPEDGVTPSASIPVAVRHGLAAAPPQEAASTPAHDRHAYTLDERVIDPAPSSSVAVLHDLADQGTEPIAIIGMACRFPGGVASPEAFWELLAHGVDAITEVPSDRWDMSALLGEQPGQIRTPYGGFLNEVAGFDAAFFRIAPVEAHAMDPQQRLLLETHWEALERAGISPDALKGSATGIYVGIFGDDYKLLQAKQGDLSTYFGTGTSSAVAAGRVAYVLGTSGPALVVDTACSSSLVAVHLACQSLRSGESSLALASGVNLLLSPEVSIAFSQATMLAPDGRCKTFDATADGYVRSEGCGVVVLKRLSDALTDGDTVLAIIRGSAINQDGASNGLTAPNGLAQEAVIRQALAEAGLEPRAIGYVEAHGTGTPLGDPIEVQALEAVYGQDRGLDNPLIVGSVKTNIGHAEAAAGIAGLIKVVLSLQHGFIPPHIHLKTLNPHLAATSVSIPEVGRPWPEPGPARPRRGAVSSFGFSGTNAHVIVEAAPPPVRSQRLWRPAHLLTLSAQSEEALRDLAGRYATALLPYTHVDLPAIAATTTTGRTHFAHRIALATTSIDGARAELGAFAVGRSVVKITQGYIPEGRPRPRVAFLFTGQGAQYLQMGRELYATQPLFRETLERCDRVLRACLGRSLIELLYPSAAPNHNDLLQSHPCGQAVTFALECALVDLWRAWGVEPDVVLGHSLGDFAAAYTAGVISLEDGLRLVVERGRLMETAVGAMVAVQASESEVTPFLAGYADVTVGVINGARSLVLSGGRDSVARLASYLTEAGFKTRVLDIPVAAHSPLLDPALDGFTTAVRMVTLAPPRLPVVSSMTGQLVAEELTDPLYWRRHLRNPIRFADGVLTLREMGCTIFVEIGPKPTLLSMAGQVLDEAAQVGSEKATPQGLMLPSLREDQGDTLQMLTSLGSLYTQGVTVDWSAFEAPYGRCPVVLPTYPFQRQRYWIDQGLDRAEAAGVDEGFARWLDGRSIEQLTAWVAERAALDVAEQQVAARILTALATERSEQQRSSEVEGWLYELVWERQAQPLVVAPSAAGGRWLILTDRGGVGETLAALLGEVSASVEVVADEAALEGWAARSGSVPLRGVVYLWAMDHRECAPDAFDNRALAAAHQRTLGGALRVTQALADMPGPGPRLWVVTQHAQQLVPTQPVAVAQAALWGLGRVIGLEHPDHFGGLVDLDLSEPAALAGVLFSELFQARPDGETEVAYREGVRHVARLARARAPGTSGVIIHPDALYLITGGLGTLGLLVAQMLADHGARHLLLIGRRNVADAGAHEALAALKDRGVAVEVAQANVSDPDAMERLFAVIKAGSHPLKGVFHTAGVIDDGILLNQRWDRFASALAAKVSGGWLLHQFTRDLDLDLMVFFSSVAALMGNGGQGSYAAANAFLDGLARQRRHEGLPALSINWGIWGEAGMAARLEHVSFAGVLPMAPTTALHALARLFSAGGQIGVVAIDWSAATAADGAARPLLARFVRQQPPVPTLVPTALAEELAALPLARRRGHLQTYLQQTVGQLLGMTAPPDSATGFTDLGMDSLLALELRRRLERACGRTLPSTLAFEYPSIDALASYMLVEVLAMVEPQPVEVARTASSAGIPADEPIAVISIACRFPGADTPEAFWQLLQDGADMVGEIPASRWDVDQFYDPRRPQPGKMYTRQAAFVANAEQFDPLFFGIAPREAATMDPQQWLLLEVSWEALERAGIAQHSIVDSKTGVFIGIGVGQYGSLHDARDLADLDTYAITSGGHSLAAGRLAYMLGLQGPTLAVDTACSSSLVALHLASQSLRSGECDMALAGGVNLMLSPTMHVALSQMQVLSPDGRCKTFDRAADGYGRGEGGAVVVLKRLSDARAAGDTVLAVISGSAINHDGPSSGLTVPNKRAQEKLVRQALVHARVSPDEVAYVETHGTGTPLGDPIELRALGAVFGAARSEPLLVGTVKSNIGHLEAAAGIAGFVKVVLAVQHGQIPPQIHFHTPNPYIEWDEFAIEVPTAARSWPIIDKAGRRVAGISSFGISGTNAHIIVEAPPSDGSPASVPAAPRPDRTRHLLALSARSAAALTDVAARYLNYVQANPGLDLGDLCSSAAVGRNHFAHRLGLVAADAAELAAGLRAFLDAAETPALVTGSIGHARPRVAFLFTGQGSQYAAMGRELYATQPMFRATIDRCDALLQTSMGESLLDVLFPVECQLDLPPGVN